MQKISVLLPTNIKERASADALVAYAITSWKMAQIPEETMSNQQPNIPPHAIRNMLIGTAFLLTAFYITTVTPAMTLVSGASDQIRDLCTSTPGCEQVRFMRDKRRGLGLTLVVEFSVAPKVGTTARQALRKATLERMAGGGTVEIDFQEVALASSKKVEL